MVLKVEDMISYGYYSKYQIRSTQDTSMGIRDMLIVLWSKVDKRFRSYLRGKKRR